METLYTLIIGFLGGVIGALGIDFVRVPFRQFFTLRTEIRHEMLRLARVAAPDPKWIYPTYSQDDLARSIVRSEPRSTTYVTSPWHAHAGFRRDGVGRGQMRPVAAFPAI